MAPTIFDMSPMIGGKWDPGINACPTVLPMRPPEREGTMTIGPPRPQRDPDRIPELLEALGKYWAAHPDLRLGQILAQYNIGPHTEDSVLLQALRGGPELGLHKTG